MISHLHKGQGGNRSLSQIFRIAFIALAATAPPATQALADEAKLLNDRQVFTLMLIDQGRTLARQELLAQIQLDNVRAELERDRTMLQHKEDKFRHKEISQTEIDIARLKDEWNRRQLFVAEKNVAYFSAERAASSRIAGYFSGAQTSTVDLYAEFRRAWEAACEQAPDELAAIKAKRDYLERSVERSRDLFMQKTESYEVLIEKEAILQSTRADYSNRLGRLDQCRSTHYPSLEQILKVQP